MKTETLARKDLEEYFEKEYQNAKKIHENNPAIREVAFKTFSNDDATPTDEYQIMQNSIDLAKPESWWNEMLE